MSISYLLSILKKIKRVVNHIYLMVIKYILSKSSSSFDKVANLFLPTSPVQQCQVDFPSCSRYVYSKWCFYNKLWQLYSPVISSVQPQNTHSRFRIPIFFYYLFLISNLVRLALWVCLWVCCICLGNCNSKTLYHRFR